MLIYFPHRGVFKVCYKNFKVISKLMKWFTEEDKEILIVTT